MVAGAGFDWLLIDTEHSPNELDMVLSQLQAVAPYDTHPVVRVPWNDMVTIKRFLDIGAQTLLIPYVQNEDEAKKAVAHTRYPPDGVRGVAGSTRANRFGRVKDYARAGQRGAVRPGPGRNPHGARQPGGDRRGGRASTASSSARPTCMRRSATRGRLRTPT